MGLNDLVDARCPILNCDCCNSQPKRRSAQKMGMTRSANDPFRMVSNVYLDADVSREDVTREDVKRLLERATKDINLELTFVC